jgi:hypothetical protein
MKKPRIKKFVAKSNNKDNKSISVRESERIKLEKLAGIKR